jgi:hypothetical protein
MALAGATIVVHFANLVCCLALIARNICTGAKNKDYPSQQKVFTFLSSWQNCILPCTFMYVHWPTYLVHFRCDWQAKISFHIGVVVIRLLSTIQHYTPWENQNRKSLLLLMDIMIYIWQSIRVCIYSRESKLSCNPPRTDTIVTTYIV